MSAVTRESMSRNGKQYNIEITSGDITLTGITRVDKYNGFADDSFCHSVHIFDTRDSVAPSELVNGYSSAFFTFKSAKDHMFKTMLKTLHHCLITEQADSEPILDIMGVVLNRFVDIRNSCEVNDD